MLEFTEDVTDGDASDTDVTGGDATDTADISGGNAGATDGGGIGTADISDGDISDGDVCDTDVTISVDEESINPGYGYTGDSFEYDGEKYILIPPTARYMDENRKSAVANLDDGDDMMTVYEYAYPEDLHVLNVSKALYCRESDLEDLYRLYKIGRAHV